MVRLIRESLPGGFLPADLKSVAAHPSFFLIITGHLRAIARQPGGGTPLPSRAGKRSFPEPFPAAWPRRLRWLVVYQDAVKEAILLVILNGAQRREESRFSP